MSKIPRDISGQELTKLLAKFGYVVIRQSGSHIRLENRQKGLVHTITIPNHYPIKIGTLNNILSDVAVYLKIEKKQLIKKLF